MSTESNDQFIGHLFKAVTTVLLEGQTVDVPGLGSFSVVHKPAEIVDGLDSSSEPAASAQAIGLAPPRDVVEFKALDQDSN